MLSQYIAIGAVVLGAIIFLYSFSFENGNEKQLNSKLVDSWIRLESFTNKNDLKLYIEQIFAQIQRRILSIILIYTFFCLLIVGGIYTKYYIVSSKTDILLIKNEIESDMRRTIGFEYNNRDRKLNYGEGFIYHFDEKMCIGMLKLAYVSLSGLIDASTQARFLFDIINDINSAIEFEEKVAPDERVNYFQSALFLFSAIELIYLFLMYLVTLLISLYTTKLMIFLIPKNIIYLIVFTLIDLLLVVVFPILVFTILKTISSGTLANDFIFSTYKMLYNILFHDNKSLIITFYYNMLAQQYQFNSLYTDINSDTSITLLFVFIYVHFVQQFDLLLNALGRLILLDFLSIPYEVALTYYYFLIDIYFILAYLMPIYFYKFSSHLLILRTIYSNMIQYYINNRVNIWRGLGALLLASGLFELGVKIR